VLEETVNYKDTLNLPQTDFPMRGDGPKREPEIQKFWFESDIYKKVLEERKKTNIGSFLLHDGPPYLSSPNIHIGTALNKILKDIVVKYKTLQGFYSPYVPGFDCHGLPIESAISKDKKKDSNLPLDPVQLRKECTEFVMVNRKSQEVKFKRLGVLGDWDNSYMTIYPEFEAAQLDLFGKMVDAKYIYRGLKPVYWCPTCQTALAEAEVEYVENYKSQSIYVGFNFLKFSNDSKSLEKYKDLKAVIWTTTPWTLPGNLAVCLNEKFMYVVVKSNKFGHLLLAEGMLSEFSKKLEEEFSILETVSGKSLENSVCSHPFIDRESPIILGDHVTLEAGTGCVHTAPGHGLEDFAVGQKYGLKSISPVDSKGLLTEEASPVLKGLYVHKGANLKVIEILSENGSLLKQEDYLHSYPHCWRSKTPIIFRATDQWFCSVRDFRTQALDQIKKVKWIPAVGENRIYSMVESRTDWCISRQRIWGVPIPAFYCIDCNALHLNSEIINNVSSIVKKSGSSIWWEKEAQDLLPNGYKCNCGSSNFKKETDTMDVWFDSGSTHYSVVKQNPDLANISDVMYLEGSDQHRGWFQSSLLTSVAINGVAPYKTVLTHGFVLDENGRKMSKSLGNVVDPEKVISEYGADILRLWVASTDYSSDMKIGQNMLKQLADVYRNVRNTIRFVLGNLYDYDEANIKITYDDLWSIDKYALHRLQEVKDEVYKSFTSFEFYKFYQILQNYCSVDLSSFYFDIVKDRLYAGSPASRNAVQFVLKEILSSLLPILAPVLPHLAEDIWKSFPKGLLKNHESALFLKFSSVNKSYMSENLINDYKSILLVKEVANKALEISRAEKKIGKSLEAKVLIVLKSSDVFNLLKKYESELPTIFIVSQVDLSQKSNIDSSQVLSSASSDVCEAFVFLANGEKCPRCWKSCTDIGSHIKHKTICLNCAEAVDSRS
jgi:isoleucyl-tRNA synthetase